MFKFLQFTSLLFLVITFDVLAVSSFNLDAGVNAIKYSISNSIKDNWYFVVPAWIIFCCYTDYKVHGDVTNFAKFCAILGSIGIIAYTFCF